MLSLVPAKFISVSQLFIILLFCCLIERSICFKLLTNENQDSDEKQYFEYYSNVEKLRESERKDRKLEVTQQTISLYEVITPLIHTFKWALILMAILSITFCIFCFILSIDWTTICKPLEYLPCQGHAILSARYNRLSAPGIYIRKNGIKDYYKPTDEEINLIVDIQRRLNK